MQLLEQDLNILDLFGLSLLWDETWAILIFALLFSTVQLIVLICASMEPNLNYIETSDIPSSGVALAKALSTTREINGTTTKPNLKIWTY